jgi:hypothetical protein
MREFPINYLALLVAVVARMVLGALWYSPLLFVGPWMETVGRTEAEVRAGLPKALVSDALGSFIMAFVLVHAVHYAGAHTAILGAAVGFFNWLGFVAVVTINSVVHEGRPFRHFLINNGYQLISLLLMGAIVAVWR